MSELIGTAGVLFVIAVLSFFYIAVLILINVIKYKKKIDAKGDDFLLPEISYFLETGKREKQEDAFYISPMTDYVDNGLIACVSDGMGGLPDGEVVSKFTTHSLKESYPYSFEDPESTVEVIKDISDKVYEKYKLGSGATLVLVHIKDNHMHFFSLGDSNIILIRDGKATLLNQKQNYVSAIIQKMAEGNMTTRDAYTDNRARGLINFLGNYDCKVLYSKSPMRIYEDDIIIVSSDGVTDTIPLEKLYKYVNPQTSARTSAERLKYAVRNKKNKRQDNYTGIVIKMERSFI
ncbi:MAG: serine/threonine-protein phosphatase [Saccharofermentans sp.]|nr:serine/threonine-protein phosphatase [Saccharofermentans sp.]